jgi:hypothetical protein
LFDVLNRKPSPSPLAGNTVKLKKPKGRDLFLNENLRPFMAAGNTDKRAKPTVIHGDRLL